MEREKEREMEREKERGRGTKRLPDARMIQWPREADACSGSVDRKRQRETIETNRQKCRETRISQMSHSVAA